MIMVMFNYILLFFLNVIGVIKFLNVIGVIKFLNVIGIFHFHYNH